MGEQNRKLSRRSDSFLFYSGSSHKSICELDLPAEKIGFDAPSSRFGNCENEFFSSELDKAGVYDDEKEGVEKFGKIFSINRYSFVFYFLSWLIRENSIFLRRQRFSQMTCYIICLIKKKCSLTHILV